ncbi:MAG: VOC family protein [Candidatus Paceibacterota bacterium]|jgi:catechol 2,3-dioxygenase-like lactoylglutathione lyase family enzyme
MKIHHIAISVKNLEKSVKFYTENFEFKEIERFTKQDWNGEAVVLQLGDMKLEVFGFNDFIENTADFENLRTIGINHFGIQVESVQEKYREFKNRGIDIDEPVAGKTCAWFCFLRDPDGISVELYETK